MFELGKIMGTSVAMIERHYGTLIEVAGADIARRLDAFEAGYDAYNMTGGIQAWAEAGLPLEPEDGRVADH